MHTDKQGIIIKADSLGSLEALITLLKQEKIQIISAGIGKINKKDVISAQTNLKDDPVNAIVLGFNTEEDEEVKNMDKGQIKIIKNEVIYRLRAILLSVNEVGLVRANEEFSKWLQGEKTMPFGENNQHVPVQLIDFENPSSNSFIVTNQYQIVSGVTKIPDLVLLINGIPVVVGEFKTPVRPSISWFDGAVQIHDDYENTIPQLFVPNIFSFASEGKTFRYGAIRMPLELWGPWREDAEETNTSGLQEIESAVRSLFNPEVILGLLESFTIFATDRSNRRIKIIARYQQYEGANLIIKRVTEGVIKKGLIWHFQGSGKSLLMVFAAQKLRRAANLRSPTVLIVVDRIDLDTQITATFNACDVPNLLTYA